MRVEIKAFHRVLARRPAIENLMKLSLYALIFQIMQSGACHHLHTIEEQCARWLLLMRDGAGSNTFLLTQEFLSEMICVRRASVNLAVGLSSGRPDTSATFAAWSQSSICPDWRQRPAAAINSFAINTRV
jgi:hypothetical protein